MTAKVAGGNDFPATTFTQTGFHRFGQLHVVVHRLSEFFQTKSLDGHVELQCAETSCKLYPVVIKVNL